MRDGGGTFCQKDGRDDPRDQHGGIDSRDGDGGPDPVTPHSHTAFLPIPHDPLVPGASPATGGTVQSVTRMSETNGRTHQAE